MVHRLGASWSHASMQQTSSRFRHAYEPLLMRLLSSRLVEVNERTGRMIKMLPGAVSFALDMSEGLLPVCGVRRMYPKTAAAEVAWFMQGVQDASFITQYAPIWDKFTEPGMQGTRIVEAAYGYRWRRHFGRDQLACALMALLANRSDRRVWVQAWDPAEDGLGAPGQANVPCPIGFTLSIVNGRLNSSLFIRSSDVFVGLPYDVMGHALLMDGFVASLVCMGGVAMSQLALGEMSVHLAHPHVYDVHIEMAQDALNSAPVDDTMPLPGWTLGQIEGSPHEYVASVAKSWQTVVQHPFTCRPEVVA
jgi:thymidylate synthase